MNELQWNTKPPVKEDWYWIKFQPGSVYPKKPVIAWITWDTGYGCMTARYDGKIYVVASIRAFAGPILVPIGVEV